MVVHGKHRFQVFKKRAGSKKANGQGYLEKIRIGDRIESDYIAGFWELRAGMHEWWRWGGSGWASNSRSESWISYLKACHMRQRIGIAEGGLLFKFAMINAATERDDQLGPPRSSPQQLARKATITYRPVSSKRRSNSASSVESSSSNKWQKKQHKKFTSQGEAEEYASRELESSETTVPEPGSPNNKRPRGVVLHGPRAPADGVGDVCIVCKLSKRPNLTIRCSHCGRRQFCSVACRNTSKEEYCCQQCQQEHGSDSDDDGDESKTLCLTCESSRHRIFKNGFSCICCGIHRFCSTMCRDNYGFVECGSECMDIHKRADANGHDGAECVVCGDLIGGEEGTAVPCHGCQEMRFCSIDCKDAQGDFDGLCDEVCYRFIGSKKPPSGKALQKDATPLLDAEPSIMNDPRNYEGLGLDGSIPDFFDVPDLVPDIPSSSEQPSEPNSELIVGHRLAGRGRYLEYELKMQYPRNRRWVDARELEADEWQMKMRVYWAHEQRQRQLDFLQTDPEHNLDRKPFSLGRRIIKVNLERHRYMLFRRVESREDGSEDFDLWEYGFQLDQS